MELKPAKAVVQCDLNGTPIQEFPSVNQAKKALKLDYIKLLKAVKEEGELGGFKWRQKVDGETVVQGQPSIVEPIKGSPIVYEDIPVAEEKVKVTPQQQEKVIQITVEQLNDIIGKAIESKVGKDETRDILKDFAESINPDYAGKQVYSPKNVPVSDYLQEPVMFYTRSFKYAIDSEMRYGQPVSTPYKRFIRFIPFSTQITGVGKMKEIQQIAVASIFSKEEVKWLRESPKYGIKFYENSRSAAQVDVFMAQHLVDAMNELAHLEYPAIRNRCIGLNIPDTGDIENMRRQLTIRIAEQNAGAEKRIRVKDIVPSNIDMNKETDREKVLVATA